MSHLKFKSFTYKNRLFLYKKKQVKYLRLKIDSNANLILSIPYFYTFKSVYDFLDKNEIWIENALKNYKKNDSNDIYFLGKKYNIVLDSTLKKTYIKKQKIHTSSKEELETFLKTNAKKIFTFYLKKWSKKTDLFYTHLSIKNMKTRWGSCNHNKAYINLNLKLLEKSLKAIEYVILHELSHIKYPNHSKEFYDFLYKFMPDFREREMEFK